MTGTPERIFAARDAWRAAMADHTVHWRMVNRLWLEYLELVDSVRARKIRRYLKCGEKDAAKTADELIPDSAVSPRSIPQPEGMQLEPSRNLPRMPSKPLYGASDRDRPFE